jgi:hypothetical protein
MCVCSRAVEEIQKTLAAPVQHAYLEIKLAILGDQLDILGDQTRHIG